MPMEGRVCFVLRARKLTIQVQSGLTGELET